MSLHASAYLSILEEIKKDLPWLIQVWLEVKKSGQDAFNRSVDVTTINLVSKESQQSELPLGTTSLEHPTGI